MSDTNKVMGEAIATIAPWRAFIHRKRAEIDAQLAQMQQPTSADVPTVITTPLEAEPEREAATVAGQHDPEPFAHASATPPSALAVRFAPTTTSTTAPTPPATEVAAVSTPPTPTAARSTEAGSTPATPTMEGAEPSKVPTVAEAQAALETALAGTQLLALPVSVQAAWHKRVQRPERVAQLLVGAVQANKVPATVRHAVTMLVQVDPHFAEANRMYRLGVYPDMFDVEDDAALDEDEDGEADEGENEEVNDQPVAGDDPRF